MHEITGFLLVSTCVFLQGQTGALLRICCPHPLAPTEIGFADLSCCFASFSDQYLYLLQA